MKYSVVIRNRNEERYIGHCIQSLVDFLGDDIQIILVDNESTDNSIRIVNTFDYLKINKMVVKKNSYSPGHALNKGIQMCDNPTTIVISAPCEITKFGRGDEQELNKTENPMNGEGVVAVWGKQIPIWDGKKVTPRYLWSNFGDEQKVNHFCKSEKRHLRKSNK